VDLTARVDGVSETERATDAATEWSVQRTPG
jgi:hypothetical protein